jgi:nitrogen-specific signal transduction histidine kinase/DNA-binding NarL/FixJ family response regulator
MKTLLVLAPHPEMADAVRAAVNPEKYRIIHRIGIDEAEPLLTHGMLDICILDVELTSAQGIWVLEKLRRRLPSCPVLAYSAAREWQWEEEAYLQGVSHVLAKPIRPRLLNALLERLWAPPAAARAENRPVPTRPVEELRPTKVAHSASEALSVLRDFSGILTHSLCADAMMRQFLLLIREILGVNRAAVFLRQPMSIFAGAPALPEGRRMRSSCAIGLSAGLLEHFELSFESGIGGQLFREGRIVRRESHEGQADIQVQKEFELLGAQVAIPILDRETLIGVATFDGRVTGEPIANGELELIFHLLEELGLAVKNIWLHDQLAANNEMMTDILREFSSACVVVSRDLAVLHANKAARSLFSRPGHRSSDLEFTDLPQALGSKVYQVLKTGAGIAPFKHQPTDGPQKLFHVTIVPFMRANTASPHAALLVVEDHTQAEAFRKLEIEAANLRLVKAMSDRLAHEIGNALVPLSTHQQLLSEKFKDPEFRASLDRAMSDSVKRVARLTNQMRYLARDSVLTKEAVSLSQLIDEAYKEAHQHQPAKSAKLEFENGKHPIILVGDRAALRHAFAEVLLNAIQANTAEAKVGVAAQTESDAEGHGWVHIQITDNGAGFTPEAAQKVPDPFFTTRTVGLGLGLCVTRKIIEVHHGRISIGEASKDNHGAVKISLPLGPNPNN